jgi:hypothetical protein
LELLNYDWQRLSRAGQLLKSAQENRAERRKASLGGAFNSYDLRTVHDGAHEGRMEETFVEFPFCPKDI